MNVSAVSNFAHLQHHSKVFPCLVKWIRLSTAANRYRKDFPCRIPVSKNEPVAWHFNRTGFGQPKPSCLVVGFRYWFLFNFRFRFLPLVDNGGEGDDTAIRQSFRSSLLPIPTQPPRSNGCARDGLMRATA